MMNRSTSADAYVSSIMSFVGLEPTRNDHHQHQKPHPHPHPHLWDWDTPTQNITPQHHQLFLNDGPFVDIPPPPFLPMNTFPLYPPEYRDSLIKREEGGRLGLNLGHRTYFSSADVLAADRLFTGSRGLYLLSHHHRQPRCQAEGCKADLSGAKHYHRRHKVCEFHSKAAFVIAGGQQQRFCQQCSRFHVLAEFDEAKRSCRKRLADHNRRRRKPQLAAPSTTQPDQDSSAPKINSTSENSTKHLTPKPTTETTRATPAITPAKPAQLRPDPTLSLGGVDEEDMVWTQTLYQHQHQLICSPATSNNNMFYHHNLFCSASNEASQSTGAGSDLQQSSGLLNLGQAMFEVDFM